MFSGLDKLPAFAVYKGLVGGKSKKAMLKKKQAENRVAAGKIVKKKVNDTKFIKLNKQVAESLGIQVKTEKPSSSETRSETPSPVVNKISKKPIKKSASAGSLGLSLAKFNGQSSNSSKINPESSPDKMPAKSNQRPPTPGRKSSKAQAKMRNRVKENGLLAGHVASSQISNPCLSLMIEPLSPDEFFSTHWEKEVVFNQRNEKSRFTHLVTSEMIDKMFREHIVMFNKHVDVTSYENGVRDTHNLEGRAHANVIWDFYSNGCSVRLLNPQAFFPEIHKFNASLQEVFGCFVGSNIYLTPPDSQGFAPHYDDIEAFVLQIEGKKRWKVYRPRSIEETLPRFSSRNFDQSEIGEPFLDVELEPGDTLYFPRGFIHQASTVPGHHSLHITVSAYQKTSWADLLEKELTLALKRAIQSNIEFRRGLPLGYLKQAGYGYPASEGRRQLQSTLTKLAGEVAKYVNVDEAVDLMGVDYIHDALPPCLSEDESNRMILQGGLAMKKGKLRQINDVSEETKIRLVKDCAVRLVEEDLPPADGRVVRLYYTLDNSKEYHAEEKQYVELDENLVPAVRFLFSTYPQFVMVKELPADDPEVPLTIAGDLWDRGLLMIESAPEQVDDRSDSSCSDSDS